MASTPKPEAARPGMSAGERGQASCRGEAPDSFRAQITAGFAKTASRQGSNKSPSTSAHGTGSHRCSHIQLCMGHPPTHKGPSLPNLSHTVTGAGSQAQVLTLLPSGAATHVWNSPQPPLWAMSLSLPHKMFLTPRFPNLPQNAGWWEEIGTSLELNECQVLVPHACQDTSCSREPTGTSRRKNSPCQGLSWP